MMTGYESYLNALGFEVTDNGDMVTVKPIVGDTVRVMPHREYKPMVQDINCVVRQIIVTRIMQGKLFDEGVRLNDCEEAEE
jgi:hypothetical protein